MKAASAKRGSGESIKSKHSPVEKKAKVAEETFAAPYSSFQSTSRSAPVTPSDHNIHLPPATQFPHFSKPARPHPYSLAFISSSHVDPQHSSFNLDTVHSSFAEETAPQLLNQMSHFARASDPYLFPTGTSMSHFSLHQSVVTPFVHPVHASPGQPGQFSAIGQSVQLSPKGYPLSGHESRQVPSQTTSRASPVDSNIYIPRFSSYTSLDHIINPVNSTPSNQSSHWKLAGQAKSTAGKPFVCRHCGYSSSRNSDLKKHERIHTGNKPFVCGTCGRAFTQSSHLKVHTRMHTGEKPYVCSVCSRAFSALCNLDRHQRRKHTKNTTREQLSETDKTKDKKGLCTQRIHDSCTQT